MPEDVDLQITNLLERLNDNPEISSRDRESIRDFYDTIDPKVPQELGKLRQRKLLRSLVIMAERHGGVAAALEDREAAEELKEWIDREYTNEESNRDMRAILHHYGKVMTPGDDAPPSLAWIPTTYTNNYDKTPDPREILTWDEDVKPMLQVCENARDRAMIALAFDAGLRGGEFKDLERRDLQDHDHGMKVTVEGKRGRRSVLLVPSVEYVTEWLGEHPGSDPGDALWSKLGTPERVSDRLIYKQFKAVAGRAGVEKPVTLTNFRKSSAAYLARRNVNQAHIEDHHGWVRGSDAAARYIQVFGEDTDREVARAHGVEVADEEELETVQSRPCPRCNATVEPHRDFCGECSQALDREAHSIVERALAVLDEQLVDADDRDVRRALMNGRENIRQSPGDTDIDELHQLVSSVNESS